MAITFLATCLSLSLAWVEGKKLVNVVGRMWDVVDEDEMRFAGRRENKCHRSGIMLERVMSRVVGMEHIKQVVVSCLSPVSLSST